MYLDHNVKTINESIEQCITAETMGNHCAQYDFFVIHSKCWWEGNPNKESVQECITFIKTLMKSIIKWHDECNEKQNDQDLSGWLRYFDKRFSSINKKVIIDNMKAFTY